MAHGTRGRKAQRANDKIEAYDSRSQNQSVHRQGTPISLVGGRQHQQFVRNRDEKHKALLDAI